MRKERIYNVERLNVIRCFMGGHNTMDILVLEPFNAFKYERVGSNINFTYDSGSMYITGWCDSFKVFKDVTNSEPVFEVECVKDSEYKSCLE